MGKHTLQVLDIVPGTSVDGPGLRTSIYFAGCAHHCEGCHNPQSWDFSAGQPMPIVSIVEVVEKHGFNVTFTGGDPLYTPEALTALAKALKERGYSIWCYTGFDFGQIWLQPEYADLWQYIDVVVDGPYIASLRDTSLRFKGSSNQRLINVPTSLQSGNIEEWDDHMTEL